MIALLICFWLLIGTAVYVFGRKYIMLEAPLVLCWGLWPFVLVVYLSEWCENLLDEYFK